MDHSAGDLPIFESGAIMWYLATQHDPEGKLCPKACTLLCYPWCAIFGNFITLHTLHAHGLLGR